MTSAETTNEQKDKMGIRSNHNTPTPASCGRGYIPLLITKEDPTLPNDASLADKLNARFDNNIEPGVRIG